MGRKLIFIIFFIISSSASGGVNFGSGDQLTVDPISATNFTITGWARRTSDENRYSTIFYLVNAADTLYIYLGTNDDGTTLLVDAYPGGSDGFFSSNPTQDVWFFFSMKCSGTGAGSLNGIYIENGSTTYETASKAGANFTADYTQLSDISYEWSGDMAAIKLWNAVLTDEEIYNEQWSYRPKRTADLDKWSPFVDGSETTFVDFSLGENWSESGTITAADGPPISW